MTESNKFKHALAQNSIINTIDTNGNITFVSELYCQLSQYTPHELIGKTAPYLSADNHSIFENVISSQQTWQGEVRELAKDGSSYWVNKTIIPILNEKKELQELLTININISEQKEQENLHQWFKDVFSRTSDVIFIVDAQTGKIVDNNETACLISEYNRQELLRMNLNNVLSVIPPFNTKEWERFVQKTETLNAENKSWEKVGRLHKKDATSVPIEIKIRLTNFENHPYLIAIVDDISQKLALEQLLEDQNKRFQALIENLDDAIFLIDEKGKTLYASPSCFKQFGYEDKAIVGKLFSRIIHKEDLPFVGRIFNQVVSTRSKIFKTTCRIIHSDQSESWVEIKAKNMLRDAGIKAIVINTHNVTNQTLAEERIILALENEKKLNEALAESEQKLLTTLDLMQETQEQLSVLVEQSPIGVQIFDTTGHIISMNKMLEKLTGLDVSKISDYCIFKDQQLTRLGISEAIERAFKGESVAIPDFKYKFKYRGEVIKDVWIRAFAYAIKDSKNEISSVVILYEDISEQVKAEQKLISTYKALEEAQEFAKLGSWYIDLKTGKTEWSKQVFVSFGMTPSSNPPESLEGFRNFIHPQDREILKNTIENAIELKQAYTLEVRQLQPNKSYKWVLTKGKPVMNEKGEIYAISGINLDIHERKLYEEKLRNALEKEQVLNLKLAKREEDLQDINLSLSKSNDELLKINAELDRFVYSASHDLRAPISSVLGLITLCKLTDNPEEISKYLDLQEKSIKKLDKFIQDILDYSRNARTEIKREEIQFRQMLEAIFDQHTYMENAEKISKVIHVHQKSKFYSDLNRLTIIFNNLIANAIRYANVYQDEPTIEVNIFIEKRQAKIEVIDNGQGIGEEHLDRIFEMFYRATEKQSGSGLGLYIVKETTEKLGGSVKLTSQIGKGTHVTIAIPNLTKNA